MFPIFIGLILAAGIIGFSRWRRTVTPFILGLFFLPGLYMAMALASQAPVSVLLQELLWGIPYFAAGIYLLRQKARTFNLPSSKSRWIWAMIGALWITHAAYDHFHPHLFINSGVPLWYPGLCIGFDTLLGIYLIIASITGLGD